MILPQGGASYLGILLSLGWSRLFEAACVPVKTPWDDVCQLKGCHLGIEEERVWLNYCDSDLNTGKNLSEPHDIQMVAFEEFTSLTEGMFDGFTVGDVMIVSEGEEVFEAGCFENLNVGTLTLIYIDLDTVPQGFFRGLTADFLHMDKCTLSNPRAGFFKGVKHVTGIELVNMRKFTYLPKDFFQGLHMLRRLFLKSPRNQLCLSQTIFQPLTSVSEIVFSKQRTSGMTYCPKMFKGFTNATTLNAPEAEMSTFVLECSSNMNMLNVKWVKDLKEKNCDRNDGCEECDGRPSCVKTPWDDICLQKICSSEEKVQLLKCDSDLKSGKDLGEPHDIKKLTFQDLTSLTEGMFDGFTVETLSMYSTRVNVFEAGCFENLNVRELEISNMGLDTVPQGFFSGLTAKYLKMSFCILSNPRAGIFKGVKSITTLELAYTQKLTYLPKDFFQGLHMLNILILHLPSNLCLSQTIFQPLTSVVRMYIRGRTSGMTYCPKMFKGFTNATTLDAPEVEVSSFVKECNSNMKMRVKNVTDPLRKNCDRNDGCEECDGRPFCVKTPWDDICQLKTCRPHIIEGMVMLVGCNSDLKSGKNLSEPHDIRTLDFQLDLISLTEGMFNGFSVDILSISSYQVDVFEAGCFENLNARYLTLDNMNLDNLPQGSFRGLTAKLLQLSRCTLSNPRAGFFKGVKNVTAFALFYVKKLTYLPKDFFQGLHMLRNLYLTSPKSKLCLPQTIFQPLKSLINIRINQPTSGMTYCPKIFKGLTNGMTFYGFSREMSSFVMECNSNINMIRVKQVEDLKEKNCDRNDGCEECEGSALLGLGGDGSAVRGRIVDAAVGVVGALSLVAVLTSVGN